MTGERRRDVGWVVRLQKLRGRGSRMLHTNVWFPHVPLALVVGAAGAAQLLLSSGALRRLIALSGTDRLIVSNVAGGLGLPAVRGVPQAAIGALMLVVGIGLLWRSRLAWVLAFLLTLATVSLELSPLSSVSKWFLAFNVVLLGLLLISRRNFTRASLATGTLFALTAVLATLGYGVLGSYVLGQQFKPKITNAVDAVYFATVTMSTVGYGDITPQTADARLFTVSLVLTGLVVFATSLTAVVGPLIDSRMSRLLQPKRKKMKRTAHIIVVGDGPLARNAHRALVSRGLSATAIWSVARPGDAELPEDLIIGDGSDSELLRKAGVQTARAVLALSDDDSFNAFVILAAKEMNPGARTVLAVADASNTRRVARVRPDVILALAEIGSELLAMALSGDEIKADKLVQQLLKLG